MTRLAERIRETHVEPGSLAIFWLAQAGFVYKTPAGQIIYIDPYLTDCVEHLYGFKRVMASLIAPEEVEADWVVSTHAHEDHLDDEAVPILARKPRTHFVGAADCASEYDRLGVPKERYTILAVGQSLKLGDATLTGVYADHGPETPDAIGVLLSVGKIKVWQVGDTCYRPDKWQDIFTLGIDIIVPPINGAYGNLDGVDAAKLARDAGARIAIPCHHWMFAEHNGNPAQFLEACKTYAPEVKPLLMTQGERFIYRQS